MKWTNHKLLTGSIVFTLGADILFTAAAVAGSVLPDMIEMFSNSFGRVRRNHRQLSHWIIPYFVGCLSLLMYVCLKSN